jgi:hypothetical protein
LGVMDFGRAMLGNGQLWRRVRLGAVLLAALLVALVALSWDALRARAQVAAAIGARVTCSCRYVEGRDIKQCPGDLDPGVGIARVTDDPQAKRVSAWVPLLASRSAHYRAGFGCLMD